MSIYLRTSQLRCRDLMPGDILLKVREDFSWSRVVSQPVIHLGGVILSRAIQAGQTVGKLAQVLQDGTQGVTREPYEELIHAGLLFDKTVMIEALLPGICKNDLRGPNLHYGYHVFRCRNQNMAAGAATCAEMMFDIHRRFHRSLLHPGPLRYGLGVAMKSVLPGRGRPATPDEMETLLDSILEGWGQPFFCAQFVVYVYQFVAEQCGVGAASVLPRSAAKAPNNVLAAALARNPMFEEAGYLVPGVR